MSVDHDESLDAELARIQAEAEVRMARARGRFAGGGPAAEPEDDERQDVDEPAPEPEVSRRMPKAQLVALATRYGWKRHEADRLTKTELVDEIESARAAGTVPGPAATAADEPEGGDPDGNDSQTWDDFWAAYNRRRAKEKGKAATTVIRGVEVVIPFDQPIAFDEHVKEIEDSEDEADVEELIAELFGADVFGQWKRNGMGSVEFQVVLLWGMAHGKGNPITFEQAVEAVETKGKSLAPSPTQNRQSRRGGRT